MGDRGIAGETKQLLAKGVGPQGTMVRTGFARRALALAAPSTAASSTTPPNEAGMTAINAGDWKLTWVDPAKSMAGEGGFGCTYKGQHTKSALVAAVKLFPAHNEFRGECRHEVEMYAFISSVDDQRRFLHIMESGVDAAIPYIVMPWAGISLSGFWKQQTEAGLTAKLDAGQVVSAVVIQTADALRFLHEKSVVHTDIKPSNLMIRGDTMQIVIIDFNAAERTDIENWSPRHSIYSTFPYRAPELWARFQRRLHPSPTRELITPGIDIWSYGVTCVETIRGGASLFGASGDEVQAGTAIVEFARSTIALERLVGTLPRWVGSLENTHEIVTCALSKTPGDRFLRIVMR